MLYRAISAWRPAPGSGGFTGTVVTAQVLAQIGAFALPALLPVYMTEWQLSATDAGWLVGIFFAAYVVTVPILLALTDRYPARRVYLLGLALTTLSHLGFAVVANGFWTGLLFRMIAGVGWAGCYMPGLKILTERLEGAAQSRVVSWHALGIGIANAGSFAVAGSVAAVAGPQAAFLVAAVTAALALAIAAGIVRETSPRNLEPTTHALFDFRPVFRNRAAMAWIAGYTAHTWEMAVLRAWGVTFLTVVISWHDTPKWVPVPGTLFALAALLGVLVSIIGNETAQYWGRLRIVILAMTSGAALSIVAGFSGAISAPMAFLVVMLWTAAIYLDSSALTAGVVQAAHRDMRGATMGLHSMCGYAGAFVGPPLLGLILDSAGHDRVVGWGLAFGHLALITVLGLFAVICFASRNQPTPTDELR